MCMPIHKLVYNYKVTSYPEEWMHALVDLPVNGCVYVYSRARKTRQGLPRRWWWWWCSHDWFLCSRQTLMVTNETSNSIKLTASTSFIVDRMIVRTKSNLWETDRQADSLSRSSCFIYTRAKWLCKRRVQRSIDWRTKKNGRQCHSCMFKRDTHNDQGYHAHSSNYQNKSMPTERGLSVQWRSLSLPFFSSLTYLTCRRFEHSDEHCNNDRLSLD